MAEENITRQRVEKHGADAFNSYIPPEELKTPPVDKQKLRAELEALKERAVEDGEDLARNR